MSEPAEAADTDRRALTLWYDEPAANWNQALPLGNGRLGAMVYGGVAREELQLNEDTVWAGGPNNNVNPAVAPYIEKVTERIFRGEYAEAQKLANQHLKSATNDGMPYQTVGSLLLDFPGHDDYRDYYRDLDIDNARASVSYRVDGVTFKREIFSSFTDQVIAIRLSADKPAQINLDLGFSSPQRHEVKAAGDHLRIDGRGSDHEGQKGQVRFTTLVLPELQGGHLQPQGERLRIRDADAVTLFVAIGTNFNNYRDLTGDPLARAQAHLRQARRKSIEQLRRDHIDYYQRQFHRVHLDLGDSPAAARPTDERIVNFSREWDPALAALYFQFGRYLLISSSQPDTQPANLQGIWNPNLRPPWESKYTVNINTEMNYWPAESTNLSELHQPLFAMLKDLAVTGRESASTLYSARGWMLHHNTDLWRITGQVDPAFYGQWQGSSAWLSQHIWYHYLHTGDKAFLREYYPVLRDAALFFADSLRREPRSGWLVVAPSNSPENAYQRDPNVSITAGSTIDNQLVFDLFTVVINAAGILDLDPPEGLAAKRAQLPPMQIGRFGQLQEWLYDRDDPEDRHRHVSHLYGLYPSNQISPYRTPSLFEAARTSLEHRGDVSTGWSMGWKVNLWARFFDGNRAYKLLQDQLSLVSDDGGAVSEKGGTYANLFDAHPPFQIDGNFGVTAGIAEMLVQSHDGAIHLLPALPDAWPNGSVKGLVTRGGFVVDMAWEKGAIKTLKIASRLGGTCRLRVHGDLQALNDIAVKEPEWESFNPNAFFAVPAISDPVRADSPQLSIADSRLIEFSTEAEQSYYFRAPGDRG